MSNTLKKRIAISVVVGLLIGLVLSEGTFIFLGRTARAPQTITVIVPAGTSELVARGEQPPTLPQGMTFVVGDVLVIENEDSVDHQLGPLWIPAGAAGQLVLGQPESLAYECSFQADNYIGMDVYESLTLGTRVYGILFTGIPMGILIALYAAILPVRNGTKHAHKNIQP
ncbi:MAG: hypothetical protein Q8L87_05330 [Anaerolineales bacterium]|jgi:hypothetical protein|nr:hypothetical protein [Anaerolineales bacterium]